MYKALVLKELRESAGLIAVAVLAAAYMLADLTGVVLLPIQSGLAVPYPFVSDTSLVFYLCLLAGGLAVLMGFKQSAWELWQGSYYFLLHRPASRRTIFGVKLAVGLGVLLCITGAVIQLYAMWAATPGKHATPFFWSMTVVAWQLWISFPLLYLGAFLSGIRPGCWFGSRLAASGGQRPVGDARSHGAVVVAESGDCACIVGRIRGEHITIRRNSGLLNHGTAISEAAERCPTNGCRFDCGDWRGDRLGNGRDVGSRDRGILDALWQPDLRKCGGHAGWNPGDPVVLRCRLRTRYLSHAGGRADQG